MNLFQESNKVELLDSLINRVTRENDYRVIKGDKKWTLFNKDEQLVQVRVNQKGTSEEIELCATLFGDIGVSMEIFIRNIVCERKIRIIAKKDEFRRKDSKIEMVRFLKLKTNLLNRDGLLKQIKSFTKKASRVQKEVDSIIDLVMFVKLN